MKERVLEYLIKTLSGYEMDHYNESTYNYSSGYRKCLLDMIQYIKKLK